jgi:hypothetical protein
MVKQVAVKRIKGFACEECGFVYKDKKTAEKCQRYCSKHHACSLEITLHAVGNVEGKMFK